MEKKYTVYMHIFPNGKKYVGCTTNAKKRWEGNGMKYQSNEGMFEDILLFGWNNIQHLILFENLTKAEAFRKECELILEHKTYEKEYGYNKSQGNLNGVRHRTPEGEERFRKAVAESMRTRIVSEESRKKMSEAKKGKQYHTQKHSDEAKLKISKSRKGKATKENHPMARPVYCVELDKVFAYGKLAEEETGVCRAHICQVCKGQRKTAGKLHWKYAD